MLASLSFLIPLSLWATLWAPCSTPAKPANHVPTRVLFYHAQSAYYGRKVELADRECVEQGADEFLELARTEDVALLVVGDPFGATTHTDLVTRCHEKGVRHGLNDAPQPNYTCARTRARADADAHTHLHSHSLTPGRFQSSI
jgi:hypothetical protein